jgi:crotonobetainyl-CoA:carnitine CoA-transferase CaiB-like acyl-CoA transferase
MPPIRGESRAFWVVNPNKRSRVLDLRRPEGQAVLHRLAAAADVLLHNFRPGVDERLGIAYGTLRALNPRLIYVALTPYGAQGRFRLARGYDLLVQAASGILGRRKLADGKPRGAGMWAVDMSTSMILGFAVALALFQRERTGLGQRIEGSLLGSAIALQMVEMVQAREAGDDWPAADLGSQAVFGAYACSDGTFVQLAVVNDQEWANLCAALERPEWAGDARFASYAARAQHTEELARLLGEALAARPAAAWSERLLAHDAPAMAVLPPDAVFDSDPAQANGMFVEVQQPGIGRVRMPGIPFRLSEGGAARFRPAPRQGEHGDEVLREAGFSADEIQRLRAGKIVG